MFRFARVPGRTTARAALVALAVLACTIAARAELEFGNLRMGMNGRVGYGYSGAFGNADTDSSNSQGFAGSVDLTGHYFHPNFISFQFRPHYDRSQSNNDSQVITRGTGFGGSVSLFGGSRFPGSITYGKDFSSDTEFRLAGVPTISGDASGQSFGITWSALVPNYPTLTASYSVGSSSASFLGFSRSETSSRNLQLTSGYQIAGFNLSGSVSHNTSHFTSPGLIASEQLTSGGSGTAYSVSAGHLLPLKGSLAFSWSHSNQEQDNGTLVSSTYYYAGTTFMPWNRLSLFQHANYITGLSAALSQSVLRDSSVTLRSGIASSGATYGSGASFNIGHGISVAGHVNYRVQWLAGRRYEDTQYGGNANFNHASRLFGFLYFSVGVVDTASKAGNQGLGLSATLGMSRKFGLWETAADVAYSQNVQTLVGLSTTSSYTYGGSLRRKINNETRWSGGFRGSHSGLVTQEGSGNHAESLSTSISWKRYSFAGSYSRSDGTAVFTSSGELTATPLGSLFTEDILLFNARSYSVNASTLLFRRLSVTTGYSKFISSTARHGLGLLTNGARYNVRAEYRLRRFSFVGGFNRSIQNVSTIAGGPRMVNSYYLSLSRWFDIF